ncbi:MAG: YicC/YloC family endoribonuclease [Acidobacteriota bacterium]
MHSMTGFGQATAEHCGSRISVTLRAVNHRYLDLTMRLPESARHLEPTLRRHLGERLHRGRIEVAVEIDVHESGSAALRVDDGLAMAVHQSATRLAEKGWIEPGVRFADLLRISGTVQVEHRVEPWSPEDEAFFFTIVDRALEQLIDARASEGAAVASALRQRLDSLRALAGELRERAAIIPARLATHLRQRIQELLSHDELPDDNRLAQEVALLVDRNDVSEELDRLSGHLDHFAKLLAADGAVGKRLDFLAQEIFRELNTTGAKCRDAEMVQRVLEAKNLCEQLREQAQNVE